MVALCRRHAGKMGGGAGFLCVGCFDGVDVDIATWKENLDGKGFILAYTAFADAPCRRSDDLHLCIAEFFVCCVYFDHASLFLLIPDKAVLPYRAVMREVYMSH
jgi:hypothetical protein